MADRPKSSTTSGPGAYLAPNWADTLPETGDGPLREQRTAQLPAIRQAEGNQMTVDERRDRRPLNRHDEPESHHRLPLRWAVIIGLSAAVGIMAGTAQSLPAGVLASLITAGGLNKVMN